MDPGQMRDACFYSSKGGISRNRTLRSGPRYGWSLSMTVQTGSQPAIGGGSFGTTADLIP